MKTLVRQTGKLIANKSKTVSSVRSTSNALALLCHTTTCQPMTMNLQFRCFSQHVPNLTISKHAENVSTTGKTPMEVYKELVKQGTVSEDPRQIELLKRLNALYDNLKDYDIKQARQIIKEHHGMISSSHKSSASASTTSTKNITYDYKSVAKEIKPHPPGLPKSLYIYGDVGCGKTFLMVGLMS